MTETPELPAEPMEHLGEVMSRVARELQEEHGDVEATLQRRSSRWQMVTGASVLADIDESPDGRRGDRHDSVEWTGTLDKRSRPECWSILRPSGVPVIVTTRTTEGETRDGDTSQQSPSGAP
ncbi:hypothetical protein GCM10028783_36870 [Modestobacter muralis]